MSVRAALQGQINKMAAEDRRAGRDKAGLNARLDEIETAVDRILADQGVDRSNPTLTITEDPKGRLCVEVAGMGCIVLESRPEDPWSAELDPQEKKDRIRRGRP
jgi:hypothetical protein